MNILWEGYKMSRKHIHIFEENDWKPLSIPDNPKKERKNSATIQNSKKKKKL